jgi:hypothetical protein
MLPLILIISLIGVYLGTISPVVYLGDSGELTAAAFSLGIAHNSGYPLYALLGKVFCLIPIGNIGFRMNLMSTSLAVLTLWLIYSLIAKMTASKVAAFVGAGFLAFTPVFWSQTVSAEVYTLHAFFVALLMRLLWWWDEKREFYALMLFVFITGISFGNHLQTVMLAPGVLFIVLTADREAILDVRQFLVLSVFFVVALSVYLYLPIRTEAGAAIHWGDPNSLDRFVAHVTGRSHRESYVLNKTPAEYLVRTKEALMFVWSQFGVMVLFSVWGLVKLASRRWRVFFVLVVVFDFVYTVFLNSISLKVTAFTLPTSIVLAVLMGVGIAHFLKAMSALSGVGIGTHRLIRVAFCTVPAVLLFFNFGLCDQGRNYSAYEHALNIFRTTGQGRVLILDGDNHVFPVVYGRVVERMREDIKLYDRSNIFFKWLNMNSKLYPSSITWKNLRNQREERITKEEGSRNVFYAVFVPNAIRLPDQYSLIPLGVLHQVVNKEQLFQPQKASNVWRYYSTESFYDNFRRDFMSREICAYFHFNRGKYLILSGQPAAGLKSMKHSSQIGYDDDLIHNDMAIFLVDSGFFEEARLELEKALIYHEDLSGVHNNWGYYYHKIGKYNEAIASFRKAIELKPDDVGYHNNLGFALYEGGKNEEAFHALKKSLAINDRQSAIRGFIKKYLMEPDSLRGE